MNTTKRKSIDMNDIHNDYGEEALREVLATTHDPAEMIENNSSSSLIYQQPLANDFPIEVLGDILESATRAIHDKTKAPFAICAQSVLTAATLAVQCLKNVELLNGKQRPLSEFFLTIGATGERKSSCDEEALAPIRDHEKQLREKYNLEFTNYKNTKEAWEITRSKIKSKTKGDWVAVKEALDETGEEPKQPLNPTIICSDVTLEGLFKYMMHGQSGMGIVSSEGGQFICGYSMSKDNKGKSATDLSLLWDGVKVDRMRSGDGFSSIEGKRFSMHLMVQPDIATMMLSDRLLQSQGLLSRFLISSPNSTIGSRSYRECNPKTELVLQQYREHLKNLLNMPLSLSQGSENELELETLKLKEKARIACIDFYNDIECKMAEGEIFYPIRSFANKLPEHAIRLAGILTLVSDPYAEDISLSAMNGGIALAKHYAQEALRLSEVSAMDSKVLMAQRLLSWLLQVWKEDIVSVADVCQRGPHELRKVEQAKLAIEILEEDGKLIRTEPSMVLGKKRRDVWRIIKRYEPIEGDIDENLETLL